MSVVVELALLHCCRRHGRYTAYVDAALTLDALRPKQVMLQRPGSGQRQHGIVARSVAGCA